MDVRPVPQPDGLLAVGAGRAFALLTRCDLEEFWPSRRSHAYDEFCR